MVMAIRPGIDDHRAVLAWRRLRGGAAVVGSVEVVKKLRSNGRAVYRITGIDSGGAAVIAKRRVLGEMFRRERAIYEHFLPQGPLDGLRFYGAVEGVDAPFGWLFIEDAGPAEYSPKVAQHRQLAGRWLGILHTEGQRWDSAMLPSACERYPPPELVQAARGPILEAKRSPRLRDAGALLDRVLARLDQVASHMQSMVDLCDRAPRVVVHGDFMTRNLRIRRPGRDAQLLAVDWENAGWGCPITDLPQSPLPNSRSWASADIEAYWSVVREHWADVDHATVLKWATCATVIRCVTGIGWDAPLLLSEWPDDKLANMALYDAGLARAIEIAGWGGP